MGIDDEILKGITDSLAEKHRYDR